MARLRGKNPALHDAYKTQLIRESMRMTFPARMELDRRQREALKKVRWFYSRDDVFKLAIHVRRTDKVGVGEAVQVGCEVFARAVQDILETQLNVFEKYKNVLIHLISDDAGVEKEWSEVAAGMEFFRKNARAIRVNFRAASNRPDHAYDVQKAGDGFYQLLIDLRLMIEAHAFLGSQSS
jgi:hypothetical protein